MRTTPIRILAIDDNAMVLEDYRKVLCSPAKQTSLSALENQLFGDTGSNHESQLGTTTLHTANQGIDGVAMYQQAIVSKPYDLVIVDMRMPPGIDGLETIRQIWNIDPNQFVVLCTAFSDYSFEELTAQLGARPNFLILHKPFEPDEMKQIVQSVATRITDQEYRDRQLAMQLSEAIKKGELSLAFQPILELATGETFAFEALCRWERNGTTVSRPDEFIRVAEDSGLICDLGFWILAEAMDRVKQFQIENGREIRVTVNISAYQLVDGFSDQLIFMVRAAGIEPRLLGLEITESKVLEIGSEAAHTVAQLQIAGFQMYLDDFGSGFSNLLGLANLAFQSFKVDRMFCAGLLSPQSTLPIVKSVIDVANALGKFCIVEGIETKEQEAVLRSLGCHYVQGYLYSKPMSFENAVQWVQDEVSFRIRKAS